MTTVTLMLNFLLPSFPSTRRKPQLPPLYISRPHLCKSCTTSQVAQWLRIHLLVQDVWETQVRSLGWEDPLKKERATHPNILAWEIPWTEELHPWGFKGLQATVCSPLKGLADYSPWGFRDLDTTEGLSTHS